MQNRKGRPLRHGYTTGACATAATKAALLSLIRQQQQAEVTIRLPIGQEVAFTIVSCEFTQDWATASVVKDGGDDPDATHGALIVSTVSWRKEAGVEIDGGVGVGRVTKPGIPVPVGEAAINPVPRQMIRETAEALLHQEQGVRVVISVPEGARIAKKTLNGRLGIVGGISILGTRGIVVPFSTSAYMTSIVQAINVAVMSQCEHVVLATGGRSEKVGMGLYPELPEEAFIEMGEFVGFALKQCKQKQVKKVTLVGMMGKFSKFAQGIMMVHSKASSVNFDFLAQVAQEAGLPTALVEQIRTCNTAAQAGDLIMEQGNMDFFAIMCRYCCHVGWTHVQGDLEIETVISTLDGVVLGREYVDGASH